MGMIRFLMMLYPSEWRQRYGAEFAALLEDTRLTPSAIADVVFSGLREHVRIRRTRWSLLAALVVSAVFSTIARLAGYAPNILWLPTGIASFTLLIGAVGPWMAWCWIWFSHRRSIEDSNP